MNKFSDFTKNNQFENTSKPEIEKEKVVEGYMNKYKNFSQQDLLNEFVKLTNQKKANGEFNQAEIDRIKETLNPYLTNEQKQNLENLINMVKWWRIKLIQNCYQKSQF